MSFLVLELVPATADDLLARLASLDREYPRARAAVVAEHSLVGYEWLVREAGAVHFTASPRAVGMVAQLAWRHLAQAPRSRRGFADEIRARLPWAPVK
jgi:hypothetical protein